VLLAFAINRYPNPGGIGVEELQAGDPQRIGPYILTARLGAGGMGLVYLGQSAGGRLVAVKVIHAQLAMDKAFRARFDREIAAARRVGGFYTAPVVDADTTGRQPWLAVGYVDGPSLEGAVAENGPMPYESLLTLGAGLAEGLVAVHAAGVVHRDLKPSNVMLAPDGVRVIDFGIAQAANDTMLTGTGLVIGSPWFMSPEQAVGRTVGPASDVFSMGGILVYAATGEGPFGAGHPAEQLYRVVHGTPRLDRLPARLQALVAQCMDKDPARRPTAGEFLARLPLMPRVPQLRPAIEWWPPAVPQARQVHQDLPADSGLALGETAQAPAGTQVVNGVPAATDPAEEAPAAAMVTETMPGAGERAEPAEPRESAPGQTGPSIRPGRWKWWRWAIPGTAVLAAGAVVISLFVAEPGHKPHKPAPPPPVLQPTGLAAAAATFTSISIHWSGPRTGPIPDKYEIVEDGAVVGSVPGGSTFYQQAGLVPATTYHFQVVAVRGGKTSPVSSAITLSTGTPPLSDAVFEWGGSVRSTTTTADPADSLLPYGQVGKASSDSWAISPACATGDCGVLVSGSLFGSYFTVTMHRGSTGTTYSGSDVVTDFTSCSSSGDNDALSIQITVTHASPAAADGVWTADKWSGSATLSIPATRCSADTFVFTLHSS
jgi:hypothetical protein